MLKTFLTLLCCLLTGMAEASPVVVAVQSVEIQPYAQALSGFQSACPANTRRLVLFGEKPDVLPGKIDKIRPDLVLAIGLDALKVVKETTHRPIIYMMVLNPVTTVSDDPDITGVSMNIPQQKQLTLIKGVLPRAQRIGLVYDPDQTSQFVNRSRQIAPALGIRILAHGVKSAREVPAKLTGMPRPDALWLVPDVTVITPATLEYLCYFSLSRKIPLITFSEKYLAVGAFMSISLDVFDIGRQAGDMATRMLNGTPVTQIPPEEAQQAVVTVNQTVARKLGISLDDIQLEKIRFTD